MPRSTHLEQLEPRQLRYVLTLAELRSFRRAAAFLSVPPGVLSREIAEMERVFGARLFERLPRTAEPTPAGSEIAEMARRALASHVTRNEDVAGAGVSLRVGWVDFGRGQAIQRAALAEFRAQYPRIPVQLCATPYRDQLRDLTDGVLNAGFFPGLPGVSGLATELLLPDSVGSALLPAGHRLARREVLALTDLSGFPFHSIRADYAPEIMALVHDSVSRGGWRGRQTTGSPQPSEVMTAVACGAAWTPVPSDLAAWAPPGVEVRPLAEGSLLRIDLHVLWREDDPVAGAFARLACELRDAIDAAVPRAPERPVPRESGCGFLLARPHAERARSERDLNDALLQDIVGSELQVEAVRKRLPREMEGESRGLEQVVERLEHAARKGREVMEALPPLRARAGDLAASLSIAADELREGSGARFRIAADGEPRELRPHVQESACWLGVEAIGNAFRHAGAALVSVTLEFRADEFRLRVADDGAGMDPAAAAGLGLSLMRERAGSAGGDLAIRSAPGAGTVVEMSVPGPSAFLHAAGDEHDRPGARPASAAPQRRPRRKG